MLIVTPAVGSVPEPRPQQLITGDRALQLLDDASSTALQAAGVKVATVSKASYDSLVGTLTPEVFAGLDPLTGKLIDGVIPDRLSTAAINALNLLDINGTVATNYLPSYLTPGGIASTIASSSAVQIVNDPDGTPVVLGASPTSTGAQTFTGTVTAPTLTAGTTHGDLITGTLGQITTVEVSSLIYDLGAQPGTPTAGSVKVWGNSSSRLNWLDSSGTVYLMGNKRVVTTLPTAPNSQLGDEVIISATGEHRIYKGVTLGWRLASPLQVADIAARDALINLYPGMRVFVSAGIGQDHVYRADNKWHGTQPYFVPGGAITNNSSVNDTNFRTWSVTTVSDPGYPYRLTGRISLEIAQLAATKSRTEVWVSVADAATGLNQVSFLVSYKSNADTYNKYDLAPITSLDLTGAKKVTVTWRCTANNTNSYSTNYQAYQDWQVVPV